MTPGVREGSTTIGQMSYLSIRPVPQLPEVSIAIGLVIKPSSSTAGPHEDDCT